MKATTKRITLATLCLASALFVGTGAALFKPNKALDTFADGQAANPTVKYYYDNMKDESGREYTLAKKFYDVFDELNTSGDFKDGVVSYPLNDIVTSDQIKEWVVDGKLDIPKAFGAARDTYYMEHPELFYVDIYKVTLSAAREDGVYSAYIDCGREANCYIDGGFKNQTEVEAAITAYNAQVNKIVAAAREQYETHNEAGLPEDLYLATYVNTQLAEMISYDYEGLTLGDYPVEKPYMYNAYGGLVENLCVCSGYSFAFKAILNKLEIPCLVINGYSVSTASSGGVNQNGEAHSWNYVWYKNTADQEEATAAENDDEGGAWYAFDVTWNSTNSVFKNFVNMNEETASKKHSPDPVISSSNYRLPYPDLYSLKETTYSSYYETGDTLDDYGNPSAEFYERLSYNGKGGVALLDEGLHLIYRQYGFIDNELKWNTWYDVGIMYKKSWGEEYSGSSKYSLAHANGQTLYTQYAIVDVEPDMNYDPNVKGNTKLDYNLYYSPDLDLTDHIIYMSEIHTNNAFGTYTPPPFVSKTTPNYNEQTIISDSMAKPGTFEMADENAILIQVTYTDPLHVLDDTKAIGVEFVAQSYNVEKYASFLPMNEKGDLVTLSEDGMTLSFKFKPSLMYEHNRLFYSFYFTNVGSAKKVIMADQTVRTSDKAPNPVTFEFARKPVVCSKCLGGGRLWIDCCAQPTLVSNTDLSEMEFKDEDGNSTFSEQARSQMMLVVDKVSAETETEIKNTIDEEFGIKETDIKSSETYDINLQICGKYPTISDGSYVKIALGFPEGYGPEDEGVTFKIFHRKHVQGNEYVIEEVPCVVTQFGIVATVTSFSPYMVVAVDASKASPNKTVYATIDGKGGTLSKEDGKVRTIEKGQSYTYTIAPDDGYGVYSVTLNGESVTDKIQNGKLTLTYDDLINNNEVVIQYISDVAAQRYETNNLEIVEPVKIVVSTKGEESIAKNPNELGINKISTATPDNTAAIIAICVVLAVCIVAGGVTAVVLLKRKKPADGAKKK